MYTNGECGCRPDNTTGEITYCPLHKSAPELYEALKLAKRRIEYTSVRTDTEVVYLIGQLDKALAKAEEDG